MQICFALIYKHLQQRVLFLKLKHHAFLYNSNILLTPHRVNPTVSHNVGLFASVCLASRLESDLDVFTLMTVAVTLFTLFPSFRRYLQVTTLCIICMITLINIYIYNFYYISTQPKQIIIQPIIMKFKCDTIL